jgi:hypothetical protein
VGGIVEVGGERSSDADLREKDKRERGKTYRTVFAGNLRSPASSPLPQNIMAHRRAIGLFHADNANPLFHRCIPPH